MPTRYVLVFVDEKSSMDSGCRVDILSEVKAHGCKVEQFFTTDRPAPAVPEGNDHDGMYEVEYASPEGRLC